MSGYSFKVAKDLWCLVDEEDAMTVRERPWHICKNKRTGKVYVRTNIKQPDGKYRGVYLHRWLLKEPELDVDHINGDTLDNRRSNLRLATQQQNSQNMRMKNKWGKGVYKNKNRFTVKIGIDGKRIYVGHYATQQEAKDAYDKKAIELFGEFALTNAMIDGGYR